MGWSALEADHKHRSTCTISLPGIPLTTELRWGSWEKLRNWHAAKQPYVISGHYVTTFDYLRTLCYNILLSQDAHRSTPGKHDLRWAVWRVLRLTTHGQPCDADASRAAGEPRRSEEDEHEAVRQNRPKSVAKQSESVGKSHLWCMPNT